MEPTKAFQLLSTLVLAFALVANTKTAQAEEERETSTEDETSTDGFDSQGIYDFMISTKALSTIPFHGSDLIIYEHPNNVPDDKLHPDNRFYVMPVVEIEVTSLKVLHSWMIDAYRLDFMLVFWSDDLKSVAIEDIEMLYGYYDAKTGKEKHLSVNQIQMIPMEEVRLIWNSEVPLPEGIWLSRDWIPFSRNPHQLKFSFMCESEEKCKKLSTEMKKNPGEFRKLNLEFTTTVKNGASREIQITGSTLTSSKVFRDLLSEDKFPGGEAGIRYLTAEDLQTLAVEVTESYVAKVTTDAQYVPSQQSLSVAELIYSRLASTKASTETMNEKAWNSLKWEPDFARPDRVTSQLNDITDVVTAKNGSKYLKINEKAFDSAENNYAYATEFQQLESYQSKSDSATSDYDHCDSSHSRTGYWWWLNFGFLRYPGGASSSKNSCTSLFNSRSSRSVSDLDATKSGTTAEKTSVEKSGLSNWKVAGDTFNDYLSDQSSSIKFDGEKFIHKPMDLYKLTVSELNENMRIVTTDIQVQRMQKIYHVKTSISSEITTSYQSDIDKINKRIDLLNEDIHNDLESVRISLMEDNKALEVVQKSMHLNLTSSIDDLHDKHSDFKEDMTEHIAILHNFTKRLDTGDVAFLVTTTITQSVSYPILNKVAVNDGDGYNILDGKFTAPVDGLYLFYFGIQLSHTSRTVRLWVGDRWVYFYEYRQYPSGTVMAQLKKGQQAYLYLGGTITVYASQYTFFGGHLITEQ